MDYATAVAFVGQHGGRIIGYGVDHIFDIRRESYALCGIGPTAQLPPGAEYCTGKLCERCHRIIETIDERRL